MTSSLAPTPGQAAIASASFTRPANTTAYASADLVANSTTAGSVVPLTMALARGDGGTGVVTRLRLAKSNTSVTNASFRVHLYSGSPTIANGDNAAWSTNGAASTYLGAVDITIDRAFTDGAFGDGVPNIGSYIQYTAATASRNIYALIEARAAYTPVSGETFTLTAEAFQD